MNFMALASCNEPARVRTTGEQAQYWRAAFFNSQPGMAGGSQLRTGTNRFYLKTCFIFADCVVCLVARAV